MRMPGHALSRGGLYTRRWFVGAVAPAVLVAVAFGLGFVSGRVSDGIDLTAGVGPGQGPASTPTGVATIVGASGVSTAAGDAVPVPGPSLEPVPSTLTPEFERFRRTLGVRAVGVVYAPIGSPTAERLGDWASGPAWSTIKVPLSLAALRQSPSRSVGALVKRAVTESDNQAAEALWARLGSGSRAASAVDGVLADHGDRQTRTQARRVRAQFSPFGQTQWSLARQVAFASRMTCSAQDAAVVREMGSVTPTQRWGLGVIPGARFKGGWGPDEQGRYLVRQFGVVTIQRRQVAVAVAVEANGGSFAEGTRTLTELARWLERSLRPGQGGCSASAAEDRAGGQPS